MSSWTKKALKNDIAAIPYLLPFFAVYLVFIVGPLVQGLWVSLHKWTVIRKGAFVGLANYSKMFADEEFWKTLWNTTFFVIESTPVLILFALVLALICNQKIKGRTFYRVSFFMPYVLSVSVISLIGFYFFQAYTGFLSQFIHAIGIKAEPNWFFSTPLAWTMITILTLWWTVGFNMILYLSALQDIPDSYYEAAGIDGATSWQQFIHITLPSLKPITLLITLLQIISSYKIFAQIWLTTGGSPGTDTRSLIMQIYLKGFRSSEMGLASAMSYVLFAILIILTLIQLKATRKEGGD